MGHLLSRLVIFGVSDGATEGRLMEAIVILGVILCGAFLFMKHKAASSATRGKTSNITSQYKKAPSNPFMIDSVDNNVSQALYQSRHGQCANVTTWERQTSEKPTVTPEPNQEHFTSVPNGYQRTYKDYGERADTVPYPNYVDYVNCIYCHQPVKAADSYFLTNGMKVHKDCYNRCLHSNGVVEKDVIGKAHAFWDGYPPDWETRKAGVLREAGYKCEMCGKSGVPLMVHHIKPLTKGGSNAFDNLQALCEQCHTQAHGGRDLKQNFDTTPDYIRQTVYQALSGHKNLYISYVDYNGRQTERTIKPYRIISRQNKHILEAYCYLRKANREFRLEHIQKAQIV